MDDAGVPARMRAERPRRKAKRPFERTLFDRVNGLVRAHSLGKEFLARLAAADDEPCPENEGVDRTKGKASFEPPLFSLSSEEDYRVTMSILDRVSSPYLRFAASPEEVLLCGRLFRRNPLLGADVLARRHFETLLLAESARGELEELAERVRTLREAGGIAEADGGRLAALGDRIKRLRAFVERVEDADSGRG